MKNGNFFDICQFDMGFKICVPGILKVVQHIAILKKAKVKYKTCTTIHLWTTLFRYGSFIRKIGVKFQFDIPLYISLDKTLSQDCTCVFRMCTFFQNACVLFYDAQHVYTFLTCMHIFRRTPCSLLQNQAKKCFRSSRFSACFLLCVL